MTLAAHTHYIPPCDSSLKQRFSPFYLIYVLSLLIAVIVSAQSQGSQWSVSLTGGTVYSDASLENLSGDSLLITHNMAAIQVHVSEISILYRRFGEGTMSVGLLAGAAYGAGLGFFGAELLRNEAGATKDQSRSLIGPLVGAALGSVVGSLVGESSSVQTYELHRLSDEKKSLVLRILISDEKTRLVSPVDSGTIPAARDWMDRSEARSERKNRFILTLGLAKPMGEFASQSGEGAGSAKAGVGFGGDLIVPISSTFSWSLGIHASFNILNLDTIENRSGVAITPGNWFSITPAAGVMAFQDLADEIDGYLGIQLGVVYGISPNTVIDEPSRQTKVTSGSGGALSYGGGLGIIFDSTIALSVRYMRGSPELEITRTRGSTSTTTSRRYPISVVQFSLGLVF